jgi:NADPH-dependent ferric siderophore reductase
MDIDHIATEPDRSPKRIRHELRFRRLDVTEVLTLSPSMVRVIFSGDDLKDFVSLGFDDHVKFFVPAEGEGMPVVPSLGPDGLVFPEGAPKPIGRDYTPRHFDPVRKTLAIDFALHDEGPATPWARQASAGMQVAIGGPRGSFIIPLAFDWHLLIADETGLPALARRLEELPTGSRAIAIVEVEGPQYELAISSRADISLHWVHRKDLPAGSVEPLISAVADIPFPAGDFHTWIACESAVAKALRTWLIGNRNSNPKWMRASGYWRRGNAGVHDHHDS